MANRYSRPIRAYLPYSEESASHLCMLSWLLFMECKLAEYDSYPLVMKGNLVAALYVNSGEPTASAQDSLGINNA
jgi:hypothetical protein